MVRVSDLNASRALSPSSAPDLRTLLGNTVRMDSLMLFGNFNDGDMYKWLEAAAATSAAAAMTSPARTTWPSCTFQRTSRPGICASRFCGRSIAEVGRLRAQAPVKPIPFALAP